MRSFAALTLAFVAAVGLAAQIASAQAPADSAQEALQAELDSLLREIRRGEDVFAAGRTPDLIVISSSDVHGEVAPCG